MVYEYSDLLQRAKNWCIDVQADGWLQAPQCQKLMDLQTRTTDNLFTQPQHRPLIVAFFGGTGVGKSSLINRLAGKQIARTGIERPTSREVTLFYHQSISLQRLPEELPIDKVIMAQHDDESSKHVLWIDMPDMDSVERQNKQLVLQWLPHIDVLCYVVSPERYRDFKAWQLLMAESARHAWLFIMNQWDRGQQEQIPDFIKQLNKAGFVNPLVSKTSCQTQTGGQQHDDFAQLKKTIEQLGNDNTVSTLEQRNDIIKKLELKRALQEIRKQFGEQSIYQQLIKQWQKLWAENSAQLSQAFTWPIERIAEVYVKNDAALLQNTSADKQSSAKQALWDDWAQSRFDDVLDELLVTAGGKRLAITPLRNDFTQLRQKASRLFHTQTELSVRQALAAPGNGLQHVMLKLSTLIGNLLPLSALAWVGFQVYEGYYASGHSEEAYLGVNFAIHSVLLIAISWLIPYFLKKQFQPSMHKAAVQGLQKGVKSGLSAIAVDLEHRITALQAQQQQITKNLDELIEQCGRDKPQQTEQDSTLSRMLLD